MATSDIWSAIQSVAAVATTIGISFNIRQIVLTKREAVAAAKRAEDAAREAGAHALATAAAIEGVVINVQKIEVATNSMKDALVASTAKASDLEGEKRGREAEVARQEATKTT